MNPSLCCCSGSNNCRYSVVVEIFGSKSLWKLIHEVFGLCLSSMISSALKSSLQILSSFGWNFLKDSSINLSKITIFFRNVEFMIVTKWYLIKKYEFTALEFLTFQVSCLQIYSLELGRWTIIFITYISWSKEDLSLFNLKLKVKLISRQISCCWVDSIGRLSDIARRHPSL